MRALAALATIELVALSALGWSPAVELHSTGLLLFALAFVAYACSGWYAGSSDVDGRLVWAAAIAMRIVLIPLAPELSDDVYRYLWDGHVQLSGFNPYAHEPAADALAGLRSPIWALINNPTVPTIYPPFAQIIFVVVGMLSGTVLAAKIAWLLFDLGTAWTLGRIADATGRDPERTRLLYLWSPLLVIEVAWSAHLETLGLFALALAILWSRRPLAAGATLALSALVKFAPAAALPALVRRAGWRAAVGFALTAAVLYLPYAGAGASLFTGLRTYGEHWWFMKGPFTLLEVTLGDPEPARLGAAVLVVAVVVWVTVKRFDLERALLWTLGAGMIVTPTLHPWYVLWMLPMAALRVSVPWLLLSGLAFLGYFGLETYQSTGEWPQPAWLRATMWLPFLIVLAVGALRGRTRHAGQAEPGIAGEEENDEG